MDEEKRAKLTETLIKGIAYGKDAAKNERDVWWDTELERFGIRIYPSGKKVFVISYRHGRIKRLKTIGGHGALTHLLIHKSQADVR
ncbi:DUF4102 domain-containing protein [Thiothrix litoralis]|uniref:DUF4102 domain-containing protein n=1 Tax=Thiothrix litoralis TaxID=2891210 RepID=A0ABX7WPR1_9GAMM|nr:DUF4102 domain-containing protein [Thiothrix litoralis]QTR45382.1 DUF4102 domain-containing protein [Thiothrix litoralis]